MLASMTTTSPELWGQALRDAGQYGALMVVATVCLVALCRYGVGPVAGKIALAAATHREGVVEAKNAAICSRDAAQAAERASDHSRVSSENSRQAAEACERTMERVITRGSAA